jgi:predicted TIM-barrel fold metal-dependent hydrolase
MNGITRRDWMASVAAAGLAAATSSKARAAAPKLEGRIIDAHVHVWSADFQKYPLWPGFTADNMWYFSYSAEELLAHCMPAGINRINLVQMTWYGTDHRYIIDVIKRYPGKFVGTGIVPAITDIGTADPDKTMVALAQDGIYAFRVRGKTIRPEFGDGDRWLDHDGYHRMFKAGAEHNLALSFLMKPSDFAEVDRMCGKYPQTPVIVDHYGLLLPKKGQSDEQYDEKELQALLALARHKRVMMKLGAFYALGKKTPPYTDMLPLTKRIVDAFGPERCMWESDAPGQDKNGHTFQPAIAVIKDHADFLSASDKEQILVKTAEDFFFKR